MSGDYCIVEDDLAGPEIAGLLQLHLDEMHKFSPPESVHALPMDRLRGSDITFWSAWRGEQLAACGALKEIDGAHGEIKSMRAHPDFRGPGAGRAILYHIMAEAAARGYSRLSLETGSTDEVIPARRLYGANGFAECGPFGDYELDPFSVYMTRTL